MNDRLDATGKLVSCLSALHPGAGATGTPSLGVSGGRSCGANVADGDPNPDDLDSGWDDDGERAVQMCDAVTRQCETYTERQEEDGSVTTTDSEGTVVGNVPAGEASPADPGTTGPSGGGSGSTGGGSGATGSGSGATGGGSGATGGGSGATGGSSGATGGGSGGGGGSGNSEADELDGQGNPHNDNGEDQCGTEPQCREPGTSQCDPDVGSCSGGCTGNDLGTAFMECTSTLPGRSAPQPIGHVDPRVIYPAPDTTTGSGMGDLLACTAGGTPSVNTCTQQSVALCTSDKPSCMCGKSPVISPGVLQQDFCQSMQCAGAASTRGEALMSGPSGISDCGCSSVMGR